MAAKRRRDSSADDPSRRPRSHRADAAHSRRSRGAQPAWLEEAVALARFISSAGSAVSRARCRKWRRKWRRQARACRRGGAGHAFLRAWAGAAVGELEASSYEPWARFCRRHPLRARAVLGRLAPVLSACTSTFALFALASIVQVAASSFESSAAAECIRVRLAALLKNAGRQCVICMEGPHKRKSELAVAPCGHFLHAKCFAKMVYATQGTGAAASSGGRCLFCRQPVHYPPPVRNTLLGQLLRHFVFSQPASLDSCLQDIASWCRAVSVHFHSSREVSVRATEWEACCRLSMIRPSWKGSEFQLEVMEDMQVRNEHPSDRCVAKPSTRMTMIPRDSVLIRVAHLDGRQILDAAQLSEMANVRPIQAYCDAAPEGILMTFRERLRLADCWKVAHEVHGGRSFNGKQIPYSWALPAIAVEEEKLGDDLDLPSGASDTYDSELEQREQQFASGIADTPFTSAMQAYEGEDLCSPEVFESDSVDYDSASDKEDQDDEDDTYCGFK